MLPNRGQPSDWLVNVMFGTCLNTIINCWKSEPLDIFKPCPRVSRYYGIDAFRSNGIFAVESEDGPNGDSFKVQVPNLYQTRFWGFLITRFYTQTPILCLTRISTYPHGARGIYKLTLTQIGDQNPLWGDQNMVLRGRRGFWMPGVQASWSVSHVFKWVP